MIYINEEAGYSLIHGLNSETQLSLHVYLSTIILILEKYIFEWSPLGTHKSLYSTGMIYNAIKIHQLPIPWHKGVWLSRGIPRCNFLTWQTVLNSCPTKDQMLSWALQTDPLCILYNSERESRTHLYFECPFS